MACQREKAAFLRFCLRYYGGTTYGSLIKASRKVNLWEKQRPMKKQRKPISLEPLHSAAVCPLIDFPSRLLSTQLYRGSFVRGWTALFFVMDSL